MYLRRDPTARAATTTGVLGTRPARAHSFIRGRRIRQTIVTPTGQVSLPKLTARRHGVRFHIVRRHLTRVRLSFQKRDAAV